MTDPQHPQHGSTPEPTPQAPTPAPPTPTSPAPSDAPPATSTGAPASAAATTPSPVDPAAPTGAPAESVAPPPPASPTLPAAATFGPPARQNKRTAVIVGAVVSATAIFGGGASLLNLVGDDGGGDKPEVVDGGGGAHNLFGPQIDPTVGPAVPEVPTTVVVPGPTPPPSVPPSTTTTTIPVIPEPDGARIDVGAGVSFVSAPGWEIIAQNEGAVGVMTDEGEFWVVLHPSAASASDVVNADLEQTAAYIQQLQVLDGRPLTPPTGAIVDAFGAVFEGIYANSQGGTIPMEGLSFGYLRNDGLGIAVSQLNITGSWEAVAEDITAMMNSVDFGTGQQLIGG